MNELQADVLVVGGGTGGTAAAIQAARLGAKTILMSEFPWLGGMLTTAGVSAPDGNELAAFQTGLWGAFLRELQQRQPGGLDRGWVSFFTFDPRIGAQIFADWVKQLPNLYWVAGQRPREVLKAGNWITGVRFEDFTVRAAVTLDATELGDLLAIAEIPHRWGWELQAEWGEPSAPSAHHPLLERYPVQAPTWVVFLQDFGEGAVAPEIPAPPIDGSDRFVGAWDNHGPERFLNYGRCPGNLLMINWPLRGNDYGEGISRLMGPESSRREFLQECRWYSQSFARFIQRQLGRRYGLATGVFPISKLAHLGRGENERLSLIDSAFGLHPYYRESRRLQGVTTVREQDILPVVGGRVAKLPLNAAGDCEAVAIGNYANDHHYPSGDIPLQPKSLRWGGRWTGTPFTIPYSCLIPAEVEGLLVCEKNVSVSHMANGATRLQPVVMGIGQAAGMAAALCVQQRCEPRNLSVRMLQEALLQDPVAPAAVIPLFNLTGDRSDWLDWQRYYLEHPEEYPMSGDCPVTGVSHSELVVSGNLRPPAECEQQRFSGLFHRRNLQDYSLTLSSPTAMAGESWRLVTLRPEVDRFLQDCLGEQPITVWGRLNFSGRWLLVEAVK